jgi:serine/threonine-protein kinase
LLRLERLAGVDRPPPETALPDPPGPETLALAGGAPPPGEVVLPVVPGYEVQERLGGGGMGTVYRARHVALDRLVALKLIRHDRMMPAMLERLRAEAQAVARLDHSHIVKVHEVGECRPTEDGPAVPYISLEFVSGDGLERRLKQQTLPPPEAARLVMLLARPCSTRTSAASSTATSSRTTSCWPHQPTSRP